MTAELLDGKAVAARVRQEVATGVNELIAQGARSRSGDHHLGNPVIRSEYKDSSVKQYVRDHVVLRTRPPATTRSTWASASRSATCHNSAA